MTRVLLFVLAAGGLMLGLVLGQTTPGADRASADWPMMSLNLAATRFSQLDQINTRNVSELKESWVFRGRASVAPIVVNGRMYLTSGGAVLALESETGKEIWRHEQQGVSARGVAYWPGDAGTPPRIVFTAGRRLIALNAVDGERALGFGTNGETDMAVPYNSPPTVYRNLLIVGANVPEQPAEGLPGNTRAFDARTGAKVWEFQSVPRPGEPGNDTWDGESWRNRSGANNWGFFMTIDSERGLLYTTFGSPASDYYGGDRKGSNLYGNSVVALEAETGKLKWHFQVVHHDIWDYDLPPAPVLMDARIDGRTVPILAQTGKVGYLYILNRVTGEPVFGIEEKPVPQSKVPGEFTSPTQPIPVKPPALGRTSYKPEDLVTAADTTAAHAQACRDLVERSGTLYNEGPFTPWAYRAPDAPPTSSVIFPGAIGGHDWGGMSVDPTLGYIFINSSDYASIGWIEQRPPGSRVPYDQVSVYGNPVASKFWDRKVNDRNQLLGEESWPCQKPPWGRLTAVNAATGDFAWQIPFGVTDELPEGKRNTGRINLGGSITTAGGLLFIGATNDRRFRAFESRTGKELWSTKLDYSAISSPITYQGKDGKQYVAISAAGGGLITSPNPDGTEALYVFTLP